MGQYVKTGKQQLQADGGIIVSWPEKYNHPNFSGHSCNFPSPKTSVKVYMSNWYPHLCDIDSDIRLPTNINNYNTEFVIKFLIISSNMFIAYISQINSALKVQIDLIHRDQTLFCSKTKSEHVLLLNKCTAYHSVIKITNLWFCVNVIVIISALSKITW